MEWSGVLQWTLVFIFVNLLTVIISPEWSSNNCNSSNDCDNASGFDSLTRYKQESSGDLLTKLTNM